MSQSDPRPGFIAPEKSTDTHYPVKNHSDPYRQHSAVNPSGNKITASDPDHQHGTDRNEHGNPDIIHRTQYTGKNK